MKLRTVFLLLLVISLTVPVYAQDEANQQDLQSIAQENAFLKERVEALEMALFDIQNKLENKALEAKAAPVASPPSKPEKPSIKSKYNVDFYGYIKMDAAKNDSQVNTGNFVRWVNPENAVSNDSATAATANETRFGFNLTGPVDSERKVIGNLEWDQMTAESTSENKSLPSLRQAFVRVDWLKKNWALTAGQTWDLIGFGVPFQLNYPVSWWVGNIGYRRPQIRLSKWFSSPDKINKLELEGGLFRGIGDTAPFTSVDTGADDDAFAFQARVAYTFPGINRQPTTFAVAGVHGNEEVDASNAGGDFRVAAKGYSLNLVLPIAKKLTYKGEYWKGSNMDAYLGGAGQGVVITDATGTRRVNTATPLFNITGVQTIKAQGHYSYLMVGPFRNWTYHLGYSIDDPENTVLPTLARTSNTGKWFTAMFRLNEAVEMGVEFSRWETEYKNSIDAVNNRIQTSVIYRF